MANSGRRRVAVVLGGTDNAGGKCGLELEMRGERFGLGIAAGWRGGIVIFVFEMCGIPYPGGVLLFDWLALFIVFLTRKGGLG